MSQGLSGTRVLLTGAARGIGAESARRLAARGAHLALLGLEPEQLEQVAASCGPDTFWTEVDVTDRDALDQAVAQSAERLAGIDVVIANAGIASAGMVRSMDPDAFERVIEVNLLGVYRTVRACLPHVVEARGYVLPIASVAAAMHGPGLAAYAASKAGVEALCDSLRSEVRHLGVDVGCGYFSWIDTDMVAGTDEHPLGAYMRGRLRGPFAKTYPVGDAADAIVRGIERRSRRVVAPGWARALLVGREFASPLISRIALRFVPEADEIATRDVERRGRASSAPVGEGGAAEDAAHKSSQPV